MLMAISLQGRFCYDPAYPIGFQLVRISYEHYVNPRISLDLAVC